MGDVPDTASNGRLLAGTSLGAQLGPALLKAPGPRAAILGTPRPPMSLRFLGSRMQKR